MKCESRVTLRYALFGEWQDELPAGLYHFVLDLGNAERDEIRDLERAPVPGQPVTFGGRTFIVDKIVPAPGSEFVALVLAHLHAA
jgi:hypothetical protein